jgi:pyrrolidone-carboxylate peptidase
MKTETYLEVLILDSDRKRLEKVDLIELTYQNSPREHLDYEIHNYGGIYIIDGLNPERKYTLKISKKGFNPVVKDITVYKGENAVNFILSSEANAEYLELGNVSLPIEKEENKVYVWVNTHVSELQKEAVVSQIETMFPAKRIFAKSSIDRNPSPSANYIILEINDTDIIEEKADSSENKLNQLRDVIIESRIGTPSLLITSHGGTPLCFGQQVTMELYFPLTKEELDTLYKRYGLLLLESYDNGTYCIFRFENLDYSILPKYEELKKLDHPKIKSVTLQFIGEKQPKSVIPTDFLFPEQWDYNIIQPSLAWQKIKDTLPANTNNNRKFGNANIKIAVTDPSGVENTHPSFNGTVVTSNETNIPKVFSVFDFDTNVNNMSGINGSHGNACAGAATALANDTSNNPGFSEGTVGIAPNSQLGCFKTYSGVNDDIDSAMFRWLAGFNSIGVPAVPLGFPSVYNGIIDLSSHSWFVNNHPLNSVLIKAFDMTADFGRIGRGHLIFFAAGNENTDIRLIFPWAEHSKLIVIGASTINGSGTNESRTWYSNYGLDMDFCAPSASFGTLTTPIYEHLPPASFGMPAPSVSSSVPSAVLISEDGYRTTPGHPALNSGHTAQATIVSHTGITVTVDDASHFVGLDSILAGLPGSQWAESRKIVSVNTTANTIGIDSAFTNTHTNQPIYGGVRNYMNKMSGTSYSTPVSAGASALILSAKSSLTWVEVRDIMRNTARKIDLGEGGGIGDWKNGPNVSDNNILNPFGDLILKSPAVSTNLTQPAHAPSDPNLSKNFTYNILQVSSISGFEIGDAVLISDGTNSEIRVIEGLSTGKITVGALKNSYLTPGSTTIEAGEYKPVFSQFYGYGRINVNNAVGEALKYNHSWRDLMVRHHIGDDGTADIQVNHHPIHSPDIWIRNTPDPTTPVPPFNQEGPHENPKPNNDRYIYVRVKNIGNGNPALAAGKKLKNLDAWVHVYVALSDKANPVIDPIFNPSPGIHTPFLFPGDPASQDVNIASKSWSDWNDIHGINGIISGDMKVYHIANINPLERNTHIEADTIPHHDPSNPDASSYVVRIKWDQLDLPPVTTNQKIYLLAYVSPVDGERQGRGAELNNNMSFREIAFAGFEFLDAPGTGALGINISVNEFGANTNTSFNVKVDQSIGSFETEDVTLEIIREKSNGTTDHLIFLYNESTSAWELLNMNNVAAPITWSTITPPTVTTTGTPATATQTSITFTGNFDVSKEFSKVKMKVLIRGRRDNTLWVSVAEDTYEMSVIQEASAPTGLIPSPGQPRLYPQSYTFTDFANITTQPANLAFGPTTGSETTKFRVTSSFTASSDVNAYAMVTGFAMIQPGAAADKVNLILRPFTQPISGFSKVKYIVYRGLRLDEFINASDQTKVAAENSSSNSEWLTQLYATHHELNPGVDFLSKALGFDPSNQPGSDLIDDYFFSTDDDFQLPFISRGTQLGKFFASGGSSDFGIDIILEDRKFTPDLDYARTAFHEIDITGLPSGTDAEKFTKRIKQDEILNFMDLAAFYGIHHTEEGKVRRRDGSNNTETIPLADLYNDVIDKFDTRNAVYIDIRNELGDSLNFFTNYNDGSGNQVQFGVESGVLTPMGYHEHGWPILIKDNASAPFNTTSDFNEAFLQLRIDDNLSPMLFVKHGDLSTTAVKNKFVEGDDLISGTNPWTNEVGFTYPNTGPSGAKLNVSWFLKLNYSRLIDSNTVYPNTVVQTNYYTDNLFGDVDAVQPWDSSDATQWTVLQPDQYVDGSQAGFGQVSEKGIAVDKAQSTDRVILYANLTDDFASLEEFTPNSGQTSGTNKRESFLTEPMLFSGYNLEFDIINSSPNVTTLRFKQNPDNPVLEQNTQVLGLSKTQLDSLKLLSGYDNRYPRTIVFDKLGDFTDVNGKPYSKFKLGLHGLNSNGQYLKQFPATDIEIYSLDELFFTSTAFADLEPIPISYKLDVEEANGAKIKHAAKTLTIDSVEIGSQYFHVTGKDSGNLSENEKITVSGSAGNNGTYTVDFAVDTGTKTTTIKVKEAIPSSTSPLGQVSYTELTWQDYFIAFDQSTSIVSPPDKMATIAANFISAVNAVPNNETAPGLLETAIDTYAPMILNRARAIVKENFSTNTPNPDDRILYWARLKMIVAIKSHPYIQKSAIDRNKLIDKFENLSRGYSSVNFSGAGSSTKKILITGFDPFDVLVNGQDTNVVQNNPSGAAALYLHDIDPVTLGVDAKIQTVIFPVRYRDFDGGVIERFFDQYFRDNSVDMVITLSQGAELRYDLERFASKYRGPKLSDNENRRGKKPTFFIPDGTSLKICDDPKSLPDFLETTLPTDSMVSTNSSDYALQQGNEIFNQAWDVNPDKQSAPKRNASNPGDTNLPNLPVPPADTVIKDGSGGNFLSNEIFYRVSLLRTERASSVRSGHLHLPLMIQSPDIDRVRNKELIQDVINMVVDGINAI